MTMCKCNGLGFIIRIERIGPGEDAVHHDPCLECIAGCHYQMKKLCKSLGWCLNNINHELRKIEYWMADKLYSNTEKLLEDYND